MSNGNLGGASFDVTANTKPFEAGMKRAQDGARRMHQVVSGEMGLTSADTARRFDDTGRAVERLNAKLGGVGKKGAGHAGLGLLAVGQAVDDLQYGFRSIVNNIPQMVYMFGGSAGIAGGAAIAAVAVNQLIQNWDRLADSMQSSWLNVPYSELERLRIKAEKADEAFAELAKKPSKFQEAQAHAIKAAIADADGGAEEIRKKLAEVITADKGERAPMSADQKERAAALDREEQMWKDAAAAGRIPARDLPMRLGFVREAKQKLADELSGANAARAKQLMGEAAIAGPEGDAARQTLTNLADRHRGAFPAGFPGAMAKANPERIGRELQDEKVHATLKAIQGVLEREERRMKGGVRGEAGVPATADQIKAIIDDVGLARKFDTQALKQVVKEIREAALSQSQAREAIGGMPFLMGQDRAMAGKLEHGPIFRKLMMGGFPAQEPGKEGPLGAAGAAATVRQQPFLRRFLTKSMRAKFAKELEGLTADQAAEATKGITDKSVAEAKKKLPQAKEAEIALDMLRQGTEAAKKKPPGPPPKDPLAEAIGDQLRASGEPGDKAAIAKQMREDREQQIKNLMAQGMTRREATFSATRQNAEQAFPQLRAPAQIRGFADYIKSNHVNTLNMPNSALPDLAKRQLEELTKIRTYLADQAKQNAKPAPAPGLPGPR